MRLLKIKKYLLNFTNAAACISIIFGLIIPVNILAYDTYSLDNASSSLLGGAYTAYENSPESLFYNPGSFSSLKKNAVHINFNKYLTGLESESGISSEDGYYPVDIFSYSLSMISSVNNKIAIGGYISSLNFYGLYGFHTFNISVSSGINDMLKINNKLGVGLGLKYYQKKYDPTPYNENYFIEYTSSLSGISLDFGLLYNAANDINIGLSFINFVSSDTGIEFKDKGVMHSKFGFKYSKNIFFIGRNRINILMDFDYYNEDFSIAGGSELELLSSGMLIGIGINLNYASAGLGYTYNETLSLKYAMNYYITGFDGTTINHKMNLGVKF